MREGERGREKEEERSKHPECCGACGIEFVHVPRQAYVLDADRTVGNTVQSHGNTETCKPADDSAFIKEIMVQILDADTHHKKLALRRLLIEAYSMAAAEVRRTADPPPSEVPRQLPTS